MSEKDAERRRAYQRARYQADKKKGAARIREWRAANPDKVKAVVAREREQHPERMRDRMREWRAANPDKVEAEKVKLRAATKARKAKRASAAKGQSGTALERAIYQRQYKEYARNNFPEKKRADNAKRRADETRATPRWADFKAIADIYKRSIFLTEVLGEPYQVDHIVPLNSALVCGLHWEGNLQVLTADENMKKSNTTWPDMP